MQNILTKIFILSTLISIENLQKPYTLKKQVSLYAQMCKEVYMFGHSLKNLIKNSTELTQTNYYAKTKNTSEHDETLFEDHESRNLMWHYLRASLRGEKDAQYKLGISYLNGYFGLDRNYTYAEKWLNQAAQQGHLEAKIELQKAFNHLAFS